MDTDGFQVISSKNGKRKTREEVDERNILSEKHHRMRSAKLREVDDTQQCTTRKKNRFALLMADEDDHDDLSASDANSQPDTSAGENSVYGEGCASDDDKESDASIVELRRMTVPNRSKARKNAHRHKHATISEKSAKDSKTKHVASLDDDRVQASKSDDDVAKVIMLQQSKKAKRVVSPIFLFYKESLVNAKGEHGEPGDKHYECLHGNRHILSITKRMKSTTIGLENHLRTKFPHLYNLFLVLKARGPTAPPTEDEIKVANGNVNPTAEQWKGLIPTASSPNDILSAFARQGKTKQGAWNQLAFENELAKWIAEEDKPFTVVEEKQFQSLLRFVYKSSDLSIPSATSIRRRIMDMKVDAFTETKELIKGLESKISLSLDAWTSSNGYAFLAIVMHFITNDWKLHKRLIRFEEIIGPHTGENLASIVWQVLTSYGLKEKLIAVTCDNATTNDTMIDAIESRMESEGILFSGVEARMRCMPHTVHLSALKLLEAIGAVKTTNNITTGYQESVTAPISAEYDNEETGRRDEPDDILTDTLYMINAVEKLRKVVRAVRASPQRRTAWLSEAAKYSNEPDQPDIALMLILDVKTRWSSTHQMLNRAYKYRRAIRSFVLLHEELHALKLTDVDWRAIRLVTIWLSEFRIATTFMSSTKACTLSSTYGCFKGLQDKLAEHLQTLASDSPPVLRDGLIAAHRKLSDYFYTFNSSPYYLWAALLDPRMSYTKLREDAGLDTELLELIESSRRALERRFIDLYPPALRKQSPPSIAPLDDEEMPMLSQMHVFSFMAHYESNNDSGPSDELNEYFNMHRETSWINGEPVKWWAARSAQFPRLSRFARDIHCIPGSAVAVERIFSGGRDTIALRRASLQPGTIGSLMLVKQWLKARQN